MNIHERTRYNIRSNLRIVSSSFDRAIKKTTTTTFSVKELLIKQKQAIDHYMCHAYFAFIP